MNEFGNPLFTLVPCCLLEPTCSTAPRGPAAWPCLHRRPGMCLPLLAAGCCSLGPGRRCAAACQQRRKAGRQHTGARHPGAAPPTARRPGTGPCALRPTAVRPADSGAAAHRGWGCRSGTAIRGGACCSCRRTGPGGGRRGARRSAERIRTRKLYIWDSKQWASQFYHL